MSREVEESHDFTGQLEFENLCAATCYAYEVSFGGKGDANATGEFRTAPAPDASAAVKFAFGGDIAGQNACRDAERGYPIFETISNISDLDFFFGLGGEFRVISSSPN
jgi:phosphodiesterase/alkaline phosphatase D-like protein